MKRKERDLMNGLAFVENVETCKDINQSSLYLQKQLDALINISNILFCSFHEAFHFGWNLLLGC